MTKVGILWLIAAAIIGTSIFAVLHIIATNEAASNRLASVDNEPQLMRECEAKTWAKLESSQARDVAVLQSVTKYCFSDASRQAMLTDYAINRTGFKDQSSESRVLLWMVVIITASGVALSGVQLFASYKLAAAASSKELADQGGTFTLEAGKVSLKSSVTGLLILAISFAFFIVFVREVYTLTDRFLDPANASTAAAEKDVLAASSPLPSSAPIATPPMNRGQLVTGPGWVPFAQGPTLTPPGTSGIPARALDQPTSQSPCAQQHSANKRHKPGTDKTKLCATR